MNAKQVLHFKVYILVTFFILAGCCNAPDDINEFKFTVVDVGEGLAQIGSFNGRAIIWDVGPLSGFTNLKSEYNRLGKPQIESIVISHSDLDHCGGLNNIDTSFNWNGSVIISNYDDTVYLLSQLQKWKGKVSFSRIQQGMKLTTFDEVSIQCLWPPDKIPPIVPTDGKNCFSLVFFLTFGFTKCLISSDIDSSIQRILCTEGYNLQADLLVVPHHGSANYCSLFVNYVNPSIAIISCSADNNYGHPSRELLDQLTDRTTTIYLTYIDASLSFCSNGFYWANK